jgi:signal transduction histidine kinase
MRNRFSTLVPRLNASVDWFIPAHLKESRNTLQAVRMFLFSHLFGPLLGHTISLSMLYVGGEADLSWWIFFFAVTAFWFYPIVLRRTGWYVPLALISIENLMFCIFWGCYQYGGMSSPMLPWLVTAPLLAFFYLPERSTRIIVTLLILANLTVLIGVYSTMGFRETVTPHGLVVLGLISTLSASIYVSMMALYFASIAFSHGELEQEVQRRQETEWKLRGATEQAKRALLAKSDFLAKMSHELKNPLNAIIGYSEILIEDVEEVDGKESMKCKDLTTIKTAGYRLLELINDLLELSKLEAGKVELHNEVFESADFFENLLSRLRPSIVASGNELIAHLPPAGRMICDSQKLQRVLEGILNNATKFTKNGRIVFSVVAREDKWILSIKDTGIGIEQGRLAGLFETFGRADHETASKYGDEVRLGLPLAYRYCRLMGGTLTVDSELGVGSTVTITLPRQSPAVQERADASMAMQSQAA